MTVEIGDIRLPLRFWTKVVEIETGCWLFTGYLNDDGYGRFSFGGRMPVAHRVSYRVLVAPIPEGMEIDHLCCVRNCVNPAHLEPVTHRENTRRSSSPPGMHGRKTHCIRGHALSGANIETAEVRRPGRERRVCRKCLSTRIRAREKAIRLASKRLGLSATAYKAEYGYSIHLARALATAEGGRP